MTQTDPAPLSELDSNHAYTLRRLVDINAKVAELNGEAEALKAELRDLPPGVDFTVDGTPALRIIPTRKFDAAGAASMLDPDARQACLTITYDAAKVKRHLTPDQVEAHMVEAGKPKVTFL